MKKVTIVLDEEVARWARIKAAQQETTLSRLVGEILFEKMLDEQNYQHARQRFISKKPHTLSEPHVPYPRRDDVHER